MCAQICVGNWLGSQEEPLFTINQYPVKIDGRLHDR
jgi:hypothetical protein